MTKNFTGRTLLAGTALLALGLGAVPAVADTYIYNYYNSPPETPYVPPASTYQYSSPTDTPPHTTYYYTPSTSPYATSPATPPASAYYYNPSPERDYVPPGLSITTPSGTYAPFYGGWSSYSMPNTRNPYRLTPDR